MKIKEKRHHIEIIFPLPTGKEESLRWPVRDAIEALLEGTPAIVEGSGVFFGNKEQIMDVGIKRATGGQIGQIFDLLASQFGIDVFSVRRG